MHLILHYTQRFEKNETRIGGSSKMRNCFSETSEQYFSIHQLYNLLYNSDTHYPRHNNDLKHTFVLCCLLIPSALSGLTRSMPQSQYSSIPPASPQCTPRFSSCLSDHRMMTLKYNLFWTFFIHVHL